MHPGLSWGLLTSTKPSLRRNKQVAIRGAIEDDAIMITISNAKSGSRQTLREHDYESAICACACV